MAELLLAVLHIDDEVNRAMGDVNTSDPVDGLFGLAATALIVVLLPSSHEEPGTLLPPEREV